MSVKTALSTARVLPFVLAMCTFLAVSGCTKTESGKEKSSAESEGIADDEVPDEESVEFVMKNERQEGVQDKPPDRADDAGNDTAEDRTVIVGDSAEMFFFYNDQPHIIPADFSLGPLQDRFSAAAEDRMIYSRFSLFFKGLSSTGIDPSFLLPAVRTELERLIASTLPKDHRPESYRMGNITTAASNKARFNIRIESGIGRSEGEIYMEKLEDQWYISGIHLDLSVLSKPYEKEDAQWQPGEYNWLPGNRF